MPNLSFGVTADELNEFYRMMKTEGETNKSAYLRKRVFKASNDIDASIGKLSRQIDTLSDQLQGSHKLIRQLAQASTDGTEMQILVGLFLMLYNSVEPQVQSMVDRQINVDGLESYLKDSKGKR